MPSLKHTQLYLSLSLSLALGLLASAATRAETPAWHFDIDATQQHQVFEESSADLRNLTLVPSVAWDNWQLSLSLPWQSIDGDYFVNQHQPSRQLLCERYANLSAARQLRWLQRGRITGEQLAACAQQTPVAESSSDHVSGLSDLEVFANYAWPLDDTWLVNFGLGYKWDNGDVELGLGSGTRELRAEVGVNATWNSLGASLTGGRTQVDNRMPEQQAANHYTYFHASFSYQVSERVSTDLGLHRQGALYSDGDAPSWFSLGVNYTPWEAISLHAGMNEYADSAQYPEREWSLGIGYRI